MNAESIKISAGSVAGKTGYFFDFGTHIEYVSLMDRQKAFEKALALVDAGHKVTFQGCSLSGMFAEIRTVHLALVLDMKERADKLIECLGTFTSTSS